MQTLKSPKLIRTVCNMFACNSRAISYTPSCAPQNSSLKFGIVWAPTELRVCGLDTLVETSIETLIEISIGISRFQLESRSLIYLRRFVGLLWNTQDFHFPFTDPSQNPKSSSLIAMP